MDDLVVTTYDMVAFDGKRFEDLEMIIEKNTKQRVDRGLLLMAKVG